MTYDNLETISTHTNQRTILIATEDEALCRQLESILKIDYPNAIYHWVTYLEIDMLRDDNIDLFLVDSTLSYEPTLGEQFHALSATKTVPVIMILSNDNDDNLQLALDSDITDYIVKPIRAVVLRQRARALLRMVDIQKALIEKEARYRLISDTISDFAYGYNVSEKGEMYNIWNTNAFETITGYKPEEIIASGWQKLVHPDDVPCIENRYLHVITGAQDKSEFRIVTKDGEVRWLLDHVRPVYSEEHGRITHVYGAAQDITERKHAEMLLQQQAEELTARNHELDAFAHTVAHDLKNPIASMMGFTSLVLNYYDRMTDDKIKEYLSLIMESTYKLKDIINSLLLLASVSKQDKIDLEALDMVEILNQSKLRLNALIQEYGAEIHIPDDFPTAHGYAPWVEEVWTNYLSNAVKYGGSPPEIRIGADAPKNGMVRYWIVDNGNGMKPEELLSVFTPFTRYNQVKIEGHGLGLSIVHRILQRLNGSAAVEIAPSGGCCFSFTLPQAT